MPPLCTPRCKHVMCQHYAPVPQPWAQSRGSEREQNPSATSRPMSLLVLCNARSPCRYIRSLPAPTPSAASTTMQRHVTSTLRDRTAARVELPYTVHSLSKTFYPNQVAHLLCLLVNQSELCQECHNRQLTRSTPHNLCCPLHTGASPASDLRD